MSLFPVPSVLTMVSARAMEGSRSTAENKAKTASFTIRMIVLSSRSLAIHGAIEISGGFRRAMFDKGAWGFEQRRACSSNSASSKVRTVYNETSFVMNGIQQFY
jgi:hypothetical protein